MRTFVSCKNAFFMCFAKTTLNYGKTLPKVFTMVFFMKFIEEKSNLLVVF